MLSKVLSTVSRPVELVAGKMTSDNPETGELSTLFIVTWYWCIPQGRLQVLSVVSGSVEFSAGERLGLPVDDKGIYPHQLSILLTLDTRRDDFLFKQG